MGADREVDCLIVGAGPAGLAAAVYLTRFHRRIAIIDDGASRAAWIPCTHNVPGFPDGVAGVELLARLRAQAAKYGGTVESGRVTRLEPVASGFVASYDKGTVAARKVLLATGIVDHKPALPNLREVVYHGNVRLCPICDGYEVTGKSVAVLGPIGPAVREAVFLRNYTADLTLLLTEDPAGIDAESQRLLTQAAIPLPDAPVTDMRIAGDEIVAVMADGAERHVEVLYPALGSTPRSDLLGALGGGLNSVGCVVTDDHQRTDIPGLYAAGDVVNELNQIAVAFGHAAIAATDIHNSLRKEDAGAPPPPRNGG